MRQRSSDSTANRNRIESRDSPPVRRPESAPAHRVLNGVLPVLRGAVGGACVRAQGIALRATDGVLHAPRTARQVGYVSFLTTLLLSILLEPNAGAVSSSLAAATILLTSAAQPLYAAVLTACASAMTTPRFTRLTRALTALAFTITLHYSPLQSSAPLQNVLFLLCLVPHITGSKRASKRHRRKFTRRFVALAIVACVCYVTLPEIGRRFVPDIPRTHRLHAHERGPTGLISVLDDLKLQYRLLIADHSILGGRFIAPQYRHETIFGQFHVHEAVRLTQGPGNRAVCLGLGVGVVAQALHDHGVKVDAVELDGVVAKFAHAYFGLSGPNVIVSDAVKWLRNAPSNTYDYAVHDVFTGGAIPSSMFSLDTLQNIRRVLRDDGVLALNFVGDTSGDEATRALSAVRARLGHVWKFVDMYGENSNATVVNVVYFASDSEDRMKFRKATVDDALGSSVRLDTLETFEQQKLGDDVIPNMDVADATDEVVNKGQWITARLHWTAMRGILDKKIWLALAGARDTGAGKVPPKGKRRRK